MFEDSTFESAGRIHTGSRNWMVATFALNSSVLLALILIPLMYPQALPRLALSYPPAQGIRLIHGDALTVLRGLPDQFHDLGMHAVNA